jgi:predicted PurR-regulated permease PerM
MTQEKSQPLLITLLLLGLLIFSFFILQPYLTSLILAAVFTIALWPVYKFILKFVRIHFLAAFLMVLIVLIVLMIPLFFLGTRMVSEAYGAYNSLVGSGGFQIDSVVQWLQEKITEAFHIKVAPIEISQYVKSILEWFVGNLGPIFSSLVRVVFTFLLSLFVLFFFFKDGSRIKKFFIEHSPLNPSYNTRLFEKIRSAVNAVVRGTLVIALINGITGGFGFFIFGLPSPALWGGLTVIASLVPALGISLVFVPAIVYLLFSGQTIMAAGLLVWGFLLIGLIDNTLGPKLVGRGMKMHPLLTFLGVIGGISLFGAIGFILGPIIFALLYVIFDIYLELAQEPKKRIRKPRTNKISAVTNLESNSLEASLHSESESLESKRDDQPRDIQGS